MCTIYNIAWYIILSIVIKSFNNLAITHTHMKSSGTFLSVLVAVAVGVVIGVTFAPDNGISTRKKAKKAVNAYAKKAKEELEASRN